MHNESFASTNDLADAWRPLSDDETARAAKLIEYASARLRSRVPGVDAALEAETLDYLLVEVTVVTMVKRAMLVPGGEGVSQNSETIGPFSGSQTYANPMGNLYITDQEIRDLGGSPATGRARTMRLTGGYC